MLRPLVILCLVLATASAALAGTLPCQCRDTTGTLHDVGAQVCLTVNGRSFMGLCAMSLNVTIWRDMEEPCPMG